MLPTILGFFCSDAACVMAFTIPLALLRVMATPNLAFVIFPELFLCGL